MKLKPGADWFTVRLVIYRRFIPCLAALALAAAPAQNAVDFSGMWKMDAAQSESAHQAVPSGPITLTIKQSAAEVSIETKRARSNDTLIYKLDGSANKMVSGGGTITTKAHWDGAKLVTESEQDVRGSTVTTLYVMSLDTGGTELTIDRTLTVHHGYQFENANNTGKGRDVFVKVKGRAKPPL